MKKMSIAKRAVASVGYVGMAWMLWMAVGCQTASIRDVRENTSVGQGKLYSFKTDSNGFDTKNFFYDSGKEVVVFDAQFTDAYAEQSIAYLRTKTQNPIKYLVITHPNPDKFNGMAAFQKLGAKVIASKRTVAAMAGVHAYKKYYFVNVAKMFTEATYPKLGTVDIEFSDRYQIKLSTGEEIALTELGSAGVSSNQTIAQIPSLKAFLVGDLIHHRAHAWLEGGIVEGKASPHINTWQQTLDALAQMGKSIEGAVVYGGRGEQATLQEAVAQQKQYLQKAVQLVENYITALGEKKAELKTDKAGTHYQALQKQFEAAFPGYSLSYMIQYGVYGLVNSRL